MLRTGRFLMPHRINEVVLSNNLHLRQRFWKRVRKTSTCWLWVGQNRRYGVIWGKNIENKPQHILVHRFSWLLHYGSIPQGKEVMHQCDTPYCVNPSHLQVGTHQENMLDCARKDRLVGRKSMQSCKYGHPYTGQNFKVNRHGWRVCILCRHRWRKLHRNKLCFLGRKRYALKKSQGWKYRAYGEKGSRFQPPKS